MIQQLIVHTIQIQFKFMTIKEICQKRVKEKDGDKKLAAISLNVPLPTFYGLLSGKVTMEGLRLEILAGEKICEKKYETPQPTPAIGETVSPVSVSIVSPIQTADPKPTEEKSKEQMIIEYKDGIMNCSYCPAEWPQKKAAWEGRDVCLCLPTYGQVPEEHHFNMMCLIARYRMALRVEHRGNDSMIARSRNQLAKRFLRTGATWSVWLDSDMVFPMGHAGAFMTQTNMRNLPEKYLAMQTIERLISHGKTMVGGCYWDRMGTGKLIAGGNQPIISPIPSDNLAAVDFVGTGCLAIHKDVFAAVAAKFPETLSDEAFGNETGFFTPIQNKNRMLGEDESFAWRAKEAGHPSYLDLGIINGHVGRVIHGMPATGSKI